MRNVKPTAVVMNMYYTGLGIARTLGEAGIPVIGLSAQSGCYGGFTRYANTLNCPDSRSQPQELLEFMLRLAPKLGGRSVLFPTRDHDVLFLDSFREQLEPWFSLVVPNRQALRASLNKWETFLCAKRAGVSVPECWLIEDRDMLERILPSVTYPCVLKPVASTDWRKGGNWELVCGRKAILVSSQQELLSEYDVISAADQRALLQEMIPGGDDLLVIAACYMDANLRFVAGFNTRKLLQVPEGFGTGCIVQAADSPALVQEAVRLLEAMQFNGIAEVEFKWNAARNTYMLIEVNPRPWDQHRLGKSCGTDLALLAYHEHAGLKVPPIVKRSSCQKWIAEDVLILTALRMIAKGDPRWRRTISLARGNRVYAIWSVKDPAPAFAHCFLHLVPNLVRAGLQTLRSALRRPVAISPKESDV
jgi:predicted ATP-grasp superfamily ATP-dependent carboligase